MHISPYRRAPISVSTMDDKRTRRRVPTSSRRRGVLRRASLYRPGAVVLIRVPALNTPQPPSSVRRRPRPVCSLHRRVPRVRKKAHCPP